MAGLLAVYVSLAPTRVAQKSHEFSCSSKEITMHDRDIYYDKDIYEACGEVSAPPGRAAAARPKEIPEITAMLRKELEALRISIDELSISLRPVCNTRDVNTENSKEQLEKLLSCGFAEILHSLLVDISSARRAVGHIADTLEL